MRHILYILVLFMASATFLYSQDQDKKEIEQIIETFRKSIIEKDKESFLPLFYKEDIPWIGAADRATHEYFKKRMPNAPVTQDGSYEQFINFIVGSGSALEEKFWNTEINSDEGIGTVTFDYSFNVDGNVQNWGKESWHLVRTLEGWKIVSVIYSMISNKVKPLEQN